MTVLHRSPSAITILLLFSYVTGFTVDTVAKITHLGHSRYWIDPLALVLLPSVSRAAYFLISMAQPHFLYMYIYIYETYIYMYINTGQPQPIYDYKGWTLEKHLFLPKILYWLILTKDDGHIHKCFFTKWTTYLMHLN